MVALTVGVYAFATEAFVGGGSWLPSRHPGWRGGAEFPETAARVSSGSHTDSNSGLKGPKLVLKLKPVQGFMPVQEVQTREIQFEVPFFNKQKKLYYSFVNEGHPASEVFVRFEGLMSWKPVGEITNTNGDFEEAVRSQWKVLVEQAYYLYKKVHFLLPRATIQFGYTDEDANIVLVKRGPYPEGHSPVDFKKSLQRSGFLGDEKPEQWRHMYTKFRERADVKKGHNLDWNKAHLMDRPYNRRLAAHKWWDINKYKGRYTDWMKPKHKRGLVVGNGPSR